MRLQSLLKAGNRCIKTKCSYDGLSKSNLIPLVDSSNIPRTTPLLAFEYAKWPFTKVCLTLD